MSPTGHGTSEKGEKVLGAKRPALVITLARQFCTSSLELQHVPNCDTMQQGVAVSWNLRHV